MQLSRREFQQSTRELSQMLRKSRSGSFWRRTSLSLAESLVSSMQGTEAYPVNLRTLLAVAGTHRSAREGRMGYSGLPDPAWWYLAQQSLLWGLYCWLQGGCAVSVHGGKGGVFNHKEQFRSQCVRTCSEFSSRLASI